MSAAPSAGRRGAVALAAVVICGLALLFRVGLLGTFPTFDELYHLLAAQGWLESGRPTILDGEYTRNIGFTALVAEVFRLTGDDSLGTGRLIAVAAGALIPPVLFVWLKIRLGWGPALAAAALAVLWPVGIDEAQTLRFYSWHVLLFMLGAILTFEAVEGRGRARIALAALAVPFMALAFYLQITTAIGVAGILLWIALFAVAPAIMRRSDRWRILGILFVAGILIFAAAAASGVLGEIWAFYRWAPQWARQNQDNLTFYHILMQTYYPTFWPLFPLAVLVAYHQAPRLASFCAVLFTTIFVFQTLGGMKADRYLSYGMPFFFAIIGLAAVTVLPALDRFVRATADGVNFTGWRWVSAALVAAVAAFVLVANPFFERSLDAVRGKGHSKARLVDMDWSAYPQVVAGWPEPEFLITSRELQTILYAGDYDVLIERSRLDEIGDGSEFSIDPRTGRPVVRELDSIAMLIQCHPNGMIVGEEFWWFSNRWGANIVPLLTDAGRSFEVRNRGDVVAVRWFGGSGEETVCNRIEAETSS